MSPTDAPARPPRGRPARVLALAAWLATGTLASAQVPDAPMPAPPAPTVPTPIQLETPPAGTAIVGPAELAPMPGPGEAPVIAGVPLLPPDVQVVRFQGPAGVTVEVLGPPPEPVPIGDGHGLATFGMRVGVGYRLKVSNIPDLPGAELFPVIEVVGHLHRPDSIDPAKYPIRVQFTPDDFEDVIRGGRLVTLVVYLEDPDQALPIHLPKDEIPVVGLSPAEEPLRVAAALGRPMAIVRLGGRMPVPEELAGEPFCPIPAVACPFAGPVNGHCPVACGPCVGTPPPPGRPWLPRDEFLCDGGDHGNAAAFAGDGNLRGIDPKDAIVRFATDLRPRLLPTNTVCLYAPRFAAVRASVGPNQNRTVELLAGHETLARPELEQARRSSRKMTQNLAAQIGRHRARASEMETRAGTVAYTELRVLAGFNQPLRVHGHFETRGPQVSELRIKAVGQQRNVPPLGIKTAESAVVSGIIAGANQNVMSWKPNETVGVEVPPNRPGLAVVKQLDKSEAEPGDVVTFTIRFRNMGNVPIHTVSVVDSLLPRLEYVAGSAQGPPGTVFTAAPNLAGSTELRWDLPGDLAPGAQGLVQFQARVR